MTRPKRSLVVVGDSDTVKKKVFFFPSLWPCVLPPPCAPGRNRHLGWSGTYMYIYICHRADHAFHRSLLARARRGSKFLSSWMSWLEDNADLRYPDLAALKP